MSITIQSMLDNSMGSSKCKIFKICLLTIQPWKLEMLFSDWPAFTQVCDKKTVDVQSNQVNLHKTGNLYIANTLSTIHKQLSLPMAF